MTSVQGPQRGPAASAAAILTSQTPPLIAAGVGRTRRENNFDILRLALAVLVIFSHSFPLALGTEATEPLYRVSRGQLTLGYLAVGWFFAISGYLITQSWESSRTVWSYLRKRIYRIYPAFVVAMAVGTWLIVPMVSADGGQVFTLRACLESRLIADE